MEKVYLLDSSETMSRVAQAAMPSAPMGGYGYGTAPKAKASLHSVHGRSPGANGRANSSQILRQSKFSSTMASIWI